MKNIKELASAINPPTIRGCTPDGWKFFDKDKDFFYEQLVIFAGTTRDVILDFGTEVLKADSYFYTSITN